MDEPDPRAMRAGAGRLVDQLRSRLSGPSQAGAHVVGGVGDVVDRLSPIGEELSQVGLGPQWGKQLDPAVTDGDHGDFHTLGLQPFAAYRLQAETPFVEVDRLIQVMHGNADVIDPSEHDSAHCRERPAAISAPDYLARLDVELLVAAFPELQPPAQPVVLRAKQGQRGGIGHVVLLRDLGQASVGDVEEALFEGQELAVDDAPVSRVLGQARLWVLVGQQAVRIAGMPNRFLLFGTHRQPTLSSPVRRRKRPTSMRLPDEAKYDTDDINMSLNPDVADAAEAAADPDRVLPQENLATTKPAEARRWVRIYAELLSFKQRVLQAAHAKLPEVTEAAARREAVDTDLVLLEAQHSRLRRRLEFWKRRSDKLSQ